MVLDKVIYMHRLIQLGKNMVPLLETVTIAMLYNYQSIIAFDRWIRSLARLMMLSSLPLSLATIVPLPFSISKYEIVVFTDQ